MKTVNHRTIKFYTLGCKANQYDTQCIREDFLGSGFKEQDEGKKAEIYVINTCTVTHRADSGSLNLVRRAKRENPKAAIVVTGCLAELDRDKIALVDRNILIAGNNQKRRIVALFRKYPVSGNGKGISYFKGHTRAFLKIQDGCNNACSYCKVPLVRGASVSRPLAEIIDEAKRLAENDYKEIVLTGICLGSWGKDLEPRVGLTEVIKRLEGVRGIARIRLSSIELQDVSEELIKHMAASDKLCRHLHIPLQSGDDSILKKMHRRYTRAEYLAKIKNIKRRIPGIAITTDVLVGFPGESEKNFLNTAGVIKEIQPLKVHLFPYSKREHTFAALRFKEGAQPLVMKQRCGFLRGVSEKCAREFKKRFLDKKTSVLIEGRCRFYAGFWEGHTGNYIKVLLKSRRDLKDTLVVARLKKIEADSVVAELC